MKLDIVRKRYQNKRSSCGLCKSHKRGWANKWNRKELYKLKEWEKIKRAQDNLSNEFT